MKAMKTIVAVMAAAGLAMAQTPASKPKAPASQTVSGSAAAAPVPKAAPAQKKAPAAKPATSKAPAKPAKKAVVAAVARPAAVKPAPAKPKTGEKRDPFVNPVVRAQGGGPGPVCATGKRCLMIQDMMLRGIVKTPNGMIAVVSNSANRAYFLRENDPIFNGSVLKITGDSVIFRENVRDNLGRETSREVVKRVNAPTV